LVMTSRTSVTSMILISFCDISVKVSVTFYSHAPYSCVWLLPTPTVLCHGITKSQATIGKLYPGTPPSPYFLKSRALVTLRLGLRLFISVVLFAVYF